MCEIGKSETDENIKSNELNKVFGLNYEQNVGNRNNNFFSCMGNNHDKFSLNLNEWSCLSSNMLNNISIRN